MLPSRPSMRPFLSVVVPAFNEAARIHRTINDIRAEMNRLGGDVELIVVDDGSTDDTADIVSDVAKTDTRVKLVRAAHAGKGAAVRRGMVEAHGRWRFLADADLSMPISELKRFLDAAAQDGDVIVVAAGSEFQQLAKNSLGELLMATPALSDGVMYVRTSQSLFAIGKKPAR